MATMAGATANENASTRMGAWHVATVHLGGSTMEIRAVSVRVGCWIGWSVEIYINLGIDIEAFRKRLTSF